ncbi:MAG: energy-coupling factor transporter transmembrane protein EcfT [Anaerolineaceae bacterium]|nr:energy-coupling factor transporter transmembrane protein EcfT [Anaerolineaceae bacterium]
MSDFEFTQRMTIGQYLPTGSALHRLDPRARIVIYIVLLAAVTFTPGIWGLVFGLLVMCVGLLWAHIPLRYALKGLLPPLPFLLILAIMQVFLHPGGAAETVFFQLGPLLVTTGGMAAGGMILLRFAALILVLSLSSFTLSTSELILGLHRLLRPLGRIGLPVEDLVLMIQVTLRFIPFLMQAAERIVKAQASRGAAWGKGSGGPLRRARHILPMIVPLFLTSLRRAENLALAMDARGYGAATERTSMRELHFRAWDWLAVAVGILLAAVILLPMV